MIKDNRSMSQMIGRWAEDHGTAVKAMITAALMGFVMLMFVFPHIFLSAQVLDQGPL